MPVLIDGNNLLHAVRAVEDPERLYGRFMLCDALGRWSQRVEERVHVVFDGPEPTAELREQIGHVDITMSFSGGIPADDLIKDILDQDSAARRLLVVSSDREVRRSAERRRAKTVSSPDFWRALKRDLAPRPPARAEPEEKQQGLDPSDTRAWLAEFGFPPSDSDEPMDHRCDW